MPGVAICRGGCLQLITSSFDCYTDALPQHVSGRKQEIYRHCAKLVFEADSVMQQIDRSTADTLE